MTEVAYLFANGVRLARLAYEPPGDVPAINGENLHVFFELGDHLGSTSVVLDKATGELVERSTYQAYGGTESDYRPERWKSFREDYRFTGKEEDVEAGLIYFGKRFLNPLLNRWVSADPLAIHGLGADPNLYAYVSGRALQSVDPLGLDGCDRSTQSCADSGSASTVEALECIMCSDPTDVIAVVDGETVGPVTTKEPNYTKQSELPASYAPRNVSPFLSLSIQVVPKDKSPSEKLDDIQAGLDTLSLSMDATGVGGLVSWVPDIANASISGARGEWGDAGLSAGASIPFAGAGFNGLRLTRYADEAADTGRIVYHELDDLGRATGADAVLTREMLDTGSEASQRLRPPGFKSGDDNHARGHLIANKLGGSGKDMRNLTTLYQNPVNSPVMRGFEAQIAAALANRSEDAIRYSVRTVHDGSELMSRGVTLMAEGDNGFSMAVTVINKSF